MRNKLLKSLIGICTLSFAFAIASCDMGTTESSPLEFELREDSYAVVGMGTYESGNLVIPSEYNGKPVTIIGESAFSANRDIGTVTIPDSVTTIEEKAFYNCMNLSKVTLGGSVTDIEEKAFATCSKIEEITGLDSVVSVGQSAFDGCQSLKKAEFSDELVSIASGAFRNCYALEAVTLGTSLELIGMRAFYDCIALKEIIVPDGAPTDIMSEAFYGTEKMGYCKSLEYVYLGDSVLSIGKSAFQSCSMLREVVLGDGLVSIGESAFSGCRKIYQITLGQSLQTIGAQAFLKCQRLAEVYNRSSLPIDDSLVGVTNDEGDIYGDVCKYIIDVRTGDEPTKISKDENGLVYYTDGDSKILISIGLKEGGILTVPNDVTEIRRYAGYNEQLIYGVIIGDNCTYIGTSAFHNSYRIEFVRLGKNMERLANQVFYNNMHLTTLVVGKNLTTVGDKVFVKKDGGTSYEMIYFEGTQAEWNTITFGTGNDIHSVARAYYSEEEPTEDGRFWHYVDGEPTLWA